MESGESLGQKLPACARAQEDAEVDRGARKCANAAVSRLGRLIPGCALLGVPGGAGRPSEPISPGTEGYYDRGYLSAIGSAMG